MKPNPVRKYRTPAYPTRLEALDDPALLREHLPAAWLLKPELAGAIAILLATNAFVNAADKGAPTPAKSSAPAKVAIVAPIFDHGKGRASVGGMAASTVFLSEEEALQVITDELTSAGLKVTDRNVVLKDVEIPHRMMDYSGGFGSGKGKVKEIANAAKPLSVDIEDSGHRVAVEYVSAGDYFDLGGVMSASTVQDYNFKETARSVAKAVGEKGPDIYFGAFYDPAGTPDPPKLADPKTTAKSDAAKAGDAMTSGTRTSQEDWEKRRKEAQIQATIESKRLLREQVKDFVDWLKGQGAI